MSDSDLGTRKSLFVVVVVVGCFAVLWPKVLHPMMVGPTTNHHRVKPNNLDKGCCDVISDLDINTIKIMNELCNNIIQQTGSKPLRGQDTVKYCRTEIFNKCGLDISVVLQEQIRLGHSFKKIVDELRSFNGSLCLKDKFGISPWSLGVPHRVTINLASTTIRQERPTHLRPEMLHPALREKGSAIPQPYRPPGKDPNVKYVNGRPGPIPGMRPPMGGGHMAQQQKGSNSMGIIMPMYTIGIVIFFSYTLMKILFKKKPEGPGSPLYPPVDPSPIFRREVFESQKSKLAPCGSAKVVNAMTALLDEVDHELEAQRRINEKEQHTVLANGSAKQSNDQPSVKILGMETTASCEGGQKWSRPDSPVIPSSPPPPPEPVDPPQEIYLEGALPAQSQLLVADAITEPEATTNEDPAIVLASKMTLSVISLDAPEVIENGKFEQQNGDFTATENEEAMEESKYTTASCATAAEPDLSEDEHTDDDMIDEIPKVPECVVDNGSQEMDIHTDDEEELSIDADEEEIEDVADEPKQKEPSVKSEIKDKNDTQHSSETIENIAPTDFNQVLERIGDVAGAPLHIELSEKLERTYENEIYDDNKRIENTAHTDDNQVLENNIYSFETNEATLKDENNIPLSDIQTNIEDNEVHETIEKSEFYNEDLNENSAEQHQATLLDIQSTNEVKEQVEQ